MSLTSNLIRKVKLLQFSSFLSRYSTGMTSMKDTIEAKLKAEFEPIHMDVEDVSGGCGASFAVLIVSQKFEGKRMIQQHRAVNNAVKAELAEIHAFQIKSMTPEQWDKVKGEYS